jgi:hypothetical protein
MRSQKSGGVVEWWQTGGQVLGLEGDGDPMLVGWK